MNDNQSLALIFDMDGVIVENHEWHFRAWIEFCRQYGITLTQEEFYTKIFGGTNHDLLTRLFEGSLSNDDIERMGEEKEAIYREMYAPHIQPVPGVVEFIGLARDKGIKTALATSAPSSNVSFTLEHTNLSGSFDIIVDSSHIKHGKPHPEIYLKAAALLNLEPRQCIVFEDSLSGITSALSAGCNVIGVATTLPAAELTMAHHIITDFTEHNALLNVVRQIMQHKVE
ncbi:MAG TPA: HAD family phosphatase [Bacteroidales bacterium]|nr:HAD family phosphatase [Bacteroidales bacterium]